MASWFKTKLEQMQAVDRYRVLTSTDGISTTHAERDGRAVTLFSSNDYLGLSRDVRLIQKTKAALDAHGMGPRAASLICGYTSYHENLESVLSRLKGSEGTLLMPSGYQANVGLLSALGGPDAVIFSDELNHASIIDGCRLSRSETKVFKHRDMNHLESLLKAESRSRKIVVTDEVFSMDGVRAPLVELAALKAKYPFILVTDSAHSTGIYGDFGSGLVNAAGVTDDVDFQVGTLSKALASHGGFVSCSERNRAWLLNSARAFIFSTALPVPNVVAATAAIEIMGNDEDVRARLWNRITELAKLMRQAPTGPIFPVIVGDEATVLKQAASLYAKGFHVPAIRPPTVPEGTCRLRITLSAAHQRSEINALYKAMVANPS